MTIRTFIILIPLLFSGCTTADEGGPDTASGPRLIAQFHIFNEATCPEPFVKDRVANWTHTSDVPEVERGRETFRSLPNLTALTYDVSVAPQTMIGVIELTLTDSDGVVILRRLIAPSADGPTDTGRGSIMHPSGDKFTLDWDVKGMTGELRLDLGSVRCLADTPVGPVQDANSTAAFAPHI